jgi:nucleolar protein 6
MDIIASTDEHKRKRAKRIRTRRRNDDDDDDENEHGHNHDSNRVIENGNADADYGFDTTPKNRKHKIENEENGNGNVDGNKKSNKKLKVDNNHHKISDVSISTDAATGEENQNGHTEKRRFIAFVGNLPFRFTVERLKTLFGSMNVTSIRLPTEKETNKPKGYAFVEFEDSESLRVSIRLYPIFCRWSERFHNLVWYVMLRSSY